MLYVIVKLWEINSSLVLYLRNANIAYQNQLLEKFNLQKTKNKTKMVKKSSAIMVYTYDIRYANRALYFPVKLYYGST